MTKFMIFLAVMMLNGPAWALDWAYVGGGFVLRTAEGDEVRVPSPDAKPRVVRVVIFRVDSSLVAGEVAASEQYCYETEILDRDKKGEWVADNQEGVLYCAKLKGSSLSESLFSRVPVQGDNRRFLCVKNCGARTPKVLRLVYDAPD